MAKATLRLRSHNFLLHLFKRWHDKYIQKLAVQGKRTMVEQKMMIKELSLVDETKNMLKIYFAVLFRMIELLVLIFFSSYYFGMLWMILACEFEQITSQKEGFIHQENL